MRIAPVTPAIGAELLEVDLTGSVDEGLARDIHAALMRHLVVFFREQPLSPPALESLAARFGRLRIAQRAAFETLEGVRSLAVIVNDEARPPNVNHYHTDGIFRAEPEFASLLRAIEVPEAGGDTIFVNMQAAYQALDDEMKGYVSARSASNDFMKLHGSPAKSRSWRGDNWARMDEMRRQNPPVVHPMVRAHPVTDRKSLYISESFTTHVVGEVPERSREVLRTLFHHYERPEFQCRFRWRPGSIALWDNRSTLHYALADYWPAKRLMHRITIETDAIGVPDAVDAGETTGSPLPLGEGQG